MVNNIDTIFNSLSDPIRRDILFRLASARLTVGEIAAEYNISLPAISKHLTVLENAGLITKQREGRRQFIGLSADALREVAAYLQSYEMILRNRLDSFEEYVRGLPATTRNTTDNVSQKTSKEIVLSHELSVSPEQAWEAYTDPRHIAQWWAPKDAELLECDIDVHEGGAWRFTFRSFDNQIHTSSGIFREVVAPSRLVYTDGSGDAHALRPESLVTVTFEPLPHGRTKFTKRLAAVAANHSLQPTRLKAARAS